MYTSESAEPTVIYDEYGVVEISYRRFTTKFLVLITHI
jgi:hypothetical protein